MARLQGRKGCRQHVGRDQRNHPKVQRVAELLPIAMLSALVAVELFDGGGRYRVEWRALAGVAAGVVALLLRRGFLVFVVAISVTALLRLVT